MHSFISLVPTELGLVAAIKALIVLIYKHCTYRTYHYARYAYSVTSSFGIRAHFSNQKASNPQPWHQADCAVTV